MQEKKVYNFGMSRPWVAELDAETGTYANAFRCGEAVSTSITPNYVEGSMYGDNAQVVYVREFKDATVNLGVTSLPARAAASMFGHTVQGNGEETRKTDDASRYVGYGFITKGMDGGGTSRYRACFLLKVKFTEGEESFETKGDSIVFKNPSLSGQATGGKGNEWNRKSPYFDTEEEADAWIQIQIGTKEKCGKPVAYPSGGKYAGGQTVTLKSATDGASVRYTLDGTTPSRENGQTYSGPVSISSTAGLRAVAYREGAEDSDVMTEEYFLEAE